MSDVNQISDRGRKCPVYNCTHRLFKTIIHRHKDCEQKGDTVYCICGQEVNGYVHLLECTYVRNGENLVVFCVCAREGPQDRR